jgi:hypothetical protein
MGEIISTAYLMGGLGNQMFQISHSFAQSLKNNVKPVFRKWAYTPMQANQPTKYLKNIYRNLEFTDDDISVLRIYENSWNDANLNFEFNTNIEFYGYFQSSKNFFDYGEIIKKLFEPSEYFLNKIHNKYNSFENSIAIHIRRGDYLSISHVLPVIDKSYIDHCLSKFNNYSKIYIFTDDKEWAKNNLNYENSIIVDDLEDYEEMWMISLCENIIMSNSTFSWWGAYLYKEKNKIFCPSLWFGPSGENPHFNIFEKKWDIINVKYNNGLLIYDEKI